MYLKNIINSDTALTPDAGALVFDKLNQALSSEQRVELDFSGMEVMTSAFLNTAIGQLYSKFNSTQLNNQLKLVNLPVEDRALLRKVIERAKEYFKDQKAFNGRMNDRYDNE